MCGDGRSVGESAYILDLTKAAQGWEAAAVAMAGVIFPHQNLLGVA